MSRRKILALDVLGEIRRAQRILRRAALFLVQQERAVKRAEKERAEREQREREKRARKAERDELAQRCGRQP